MTGGVEYSDAADHARLLSEPKLIRTVTVEL